MKPFDEIIDPKQTRLKLGLNQQDFWSKIGVTQSGGSRYENGRKMAKPVRELLRLVHIEGLDLAKVKREDIDIAKLLKRREPNMYKTLKKTVRSRGAG